MKKIAQEIVKGKNLQENLSVFANNMMGLYNDYSFIRLAMNYFTYYGMVSEGEQKDEGLKDISNTFNNIIKNAIVGSVSGDEWENALKDTYAVRNRVINMMKGLTAYVDIFNIFEYCLNRVEYRFKDGSEFLKVSDEELSAQLLNFILSDKDNVVMNGKIAEIVRQLPMRMTKNKFYELLAEGIKVYKGSEISSVEDFLYMLKTTAMIEVSPYTELLSEDVRLIYDEFIKTSFDSITKEKYDDLKSKSDFVISYLMNSINMYMTMGELINDVYVILLSKPYILSGSENEKICKAIVKNVSNMFDESISDEEYDRVAEKFTDLEGKQESLHMKFSSYEYVTEHANKEYGDVINGLMLEKVYTSLEHIASLESGSIFVEFNEKNTEPADESYIIKATETFIGQLKGFFGSHEKIINRAVMAHVLSGLPVFFNNVDEIQSYIKTALGQCSDTAEKAAVIEIMEQLQEEM